MCQKSKQYKKGANFFSSHLGRLLYEGNKLTRERKVERERQRDREREREREKERERK